MDSVHRGERAGGGGAGVRGGWEAKSKAGYIIHQYKNSHSVRVRPRRLLAAV